MSPASQEELTALLNQVFELNSLSEYTTKDKRLQRIHFDWLEAGEYTQRTVAKLSQQLRRYLDDQTYLENKRIMQLLDGINAQALQVKHNPPKEVFMSLNEPAPTIHLSMDRPLFSPPVRARLNTKILTGNADKLVPEALFNQIVINKEQLISNINRARGLEQQITLADVIERHRAIRFGFV